MFQKRKQVGPYFKTINPVNPITGDAHYLYPPLKQYCRFVLTEQLTTRDEVKKATIIDRDQWGYNPIYHCPDVIIHVHNLLVQEAVAADAEADPPVAAVPAIYTFYGPIGASGFAVWDQSNHWRIVYMVGGLRGACLLEQHPGRGQPFGIMLGFWATDNDSWAYVEADEGVAIDWRFGVPYPDAGATGLFEARESEKYGTIWEVVSLDCTSPGACGD
mgnify:CR=1 FL=1